MIDYGWIVAGVLALVCVWLIWLESSTAEKAYQTGISVGRLLAIEEFIMTYIKHKGPRYEALMQFLTAEGRAAVDESREVIGSVK